MRPNKLVLVCAVIVLAAVGHHAVADPSKGQSPPSQTHQSCIEHGGDDIRCLLFCAICGHHDCSPDCPSRRPPDQPAPFSLDCSNAAQAVEEARRIDLARQAREQTAVMQPYLRDWSKPGDDPEGDYWHLKGRTDPRRVSGGQLIRELGSAIKGLLGFEDGEVPEVDSEPLIPNRGRLPGILGFLQALRDVLGVVGEIQIQRDRQYADALLEAEADLDGQAQSMSARAKLFEGLAEGCGELSAADAGILKSAARDLRARLAVVQARLEAVRSSLNAVKTRLHNFKDRSPPDIYVPQGSGRGA